MEKVVARFEEFFSLKDLECLLVDPPYSLRQCEVVVKQFESINRAVTHQGEDLLEYTLMHCPQLMMLLSYLRYSAHTGKIVKHLSLKHLRKRYEPLVSAFRQSRCDFALAIFEQNSPAVNVLGQENTARH